MDVLSDLVAEYDQLEAVLVGLDAEQWAAPSGAPGWAVRDVVTHLAQTEEGVEATIRAGAGAWNERHGETLDAQLHRQVLADRAEPAAVLARWQAARRASIEALASADPGVAVMWAAAPLRPMTLATTRLAEHWAHALDVAVPLGLDYPDTDRLRHIAWLGHRTLPYAFGLAGEAAPDVWCRLTGLSGAAWELGPADAASRISGPAAAFCRVGARRLDPEASGLVAEGPHAAAALRVLRNYAA